MSRLFFPVSFLSVRWRSVWGQMAPSHPSSMARRLTGQHSLVPIVKWIGKLMKRGMRHPLLIGVGLWLSLWVWNWPLAVAIASGTGVAIAVYLYQLGRLHVSWFNQFVEMDAVVGDQSVWQERLARFGHRVSNMITPLWSHCWQPINRPLTIALLSGSLLASVVAMVGWLYRDLHSLSLVCAMGLQLVMVGIIGYGVWRQTNGVSRSLGYWSERGGEQAVAEAIASTTSASTASTIDRLWADLTSPNTSVRLIAIYRSVNWVQSLSTHSAAMAPGLKIGMNAQMLTACFRVMMSHESNPNVQQALRDGLMTLQNQKLKDNVGNP